MKTRNPLNILCNTLLTALLTTGVLGCMWSAFSYSVESRRLLLFIVLFSLFACLCCAFRRGILVVAGGLFLAIPLLWWLGLEAHTEAFLWKLSRTYDGVYDLGFMICWTADDHTGMPTTLFFLLLALVLITVTAFGLSRRRAWPGVSLALQLLAVTLAVPSETLNSVYFFLALLALGILALSASVRRHNPGDTPTITLTAAAAGVAALVLLLIILPQGSYVPSGGLDTGNFISSIVQWFDPQIQSSLGGDGQGISDSVELGQVGPRVPDNEEVFTAYSDYHGYLYLRGRSYESYTGTAWKADPNLESTLGMEVDPGLFDTHEITLFYKNGIQNQGVLYIPWHPGQQTLTGGLVPKTDKKPRFDHTFNVPRNGWDDANSLIAMPYTPADAQTHLQEAGFSPEVYLSLPETTSARAQHLLRGIGVQENMPLNYVIHTVRGYLSRTASYDPDTGNMPAGTEDFAMWFLEESDTGYCVHFASAAAVLLRAAGIPARYVEGYLLYSQANTNLTVSKQQAHAWVEYYVPTLGWMILEATPDDGLPEPLPEAPETEPTSTPPATEPSTAPPTEPPTQPTTEPATEPPTKPSEKPTEPSATPRPPETEPGGNGPGGSDADFSWLYALLRIVGWIVGICAILVLQWRLRLMLLLRRLHRGEPNTQALRRWRHCCLLARLHRQQPPDVLRKLAEKAKYSQHTLTQEELRQFDRYRITSVGQLRRKGLHMQFVYRMILALY